MGQKNGFYFPYPRLSRVKINGLRGCVTVLELVFAGKCEVFVCLAFVHFFPLAAKLIGPRTVCQFFKNVDFSDTYPLNWVWTTKQLKRTKS